MRYSLCLVATICITLVASLPAPANAEKRVALVIGNGSYVHIADLPNVTNDARAMADLFKNAKFDTIDVKQNLGVSELRRTLREFATRVADADVAVLFYAGHGIEVGQVNYLIPVDARLLTDFDIEDETVPLDRVLQAMEPAKRLRLLILDACRENPFVQSMKRTVAARSIGRGLGRVEPSITNTLIAFATKPNGIAEDGNGPNSPFTAALVKYLLTPGLDLRIALGYVRDEVLTSTMSKQEPYVTGSLGGGLVSIVGSSPTPTGPAPPPKSSQPEPDPAITPSLAKPVKPKSASSFDGAWHLEFSYNEHCGQKRAMRPSNTWRIREGRLEGQASSGIARGTVSHDGELQVRWPNPFDPARLQTLSAKLQGDRGEGRWFSGFGSCGGSVKLTRT